MKLEFKRLLHSGNSSEQYGHNEPTVVKETSRIELVDTQLPTGTEGSNLYQRKKIVPNLK